jgi:glycosyltransferase involved in cell wall biosynthesis
MAPRAIIHVITRLDRGGAAQNTQLTLLGHDRSRFEPAVVAGRAGRWDAQGGDQATEANLQQLQRAGIPSEMLATLTRGISPVQDFVTFCRLVSLFRQRRPALVHTHTSKAGVLGRLAAWAAGVKLVVHTPHGHVFYGHFGRIASAVFLQIERLLAKGTTHMIALTEAERDEHLVLGVGEAGRFSVIPSGIDLERYRRAGASAGTARPRPSSFGCPPEAIVVGSVGWLTEVKGHRYLIEALAILKAARPMLHLVIIGSGHLREDYLALGARLGLEGSLHLLGSRTDVPECLGGMDFFVLPSLNEGMGRALIEAMAAGLPVVASRVGGVPAIVEDRRTGLLVPPGDAAALAAALDELLRRPDWTRELGEAAGRSIGERFSSTAMVKAVEAVYDTVLSTSGRGRAT